MRKFTFYCFIFLGFIASAQLKLNEVCYTNATIKFDEDSSSSDFIELYNPTSNPISLNNYCLSDDITEKKKWRFGNIVLAPNAYYMVYASNKNRKHIVNHWETAINNNVIWKYELASASSDTNWKKPGFSDAAWLSGQGGIGNSNSDDNTNVSPQHALYMRYAFSITDTSKISRALLNADYDDGFVAYINGVEVARSQSMMGINQPIAFNALANYTRKALSQGNVDSNSREGFYIEKKLLEKVLKNGTNYLCIEVHNRSQYGSMTSNFHLSFGLSDASVQFGALPNWFSAKPGPYMHTNFGLSENETVYLTDYNTGIVVDNILLNGADINHSIARIPDGSNNQCFMGIPTPSQTNNSSNCYIGYEPTPLFLLPAGVYNSNQNVTVLPLSPSSVVRYTLDGSKPKSTSNLYTGAVALTSTAVIGVRAFSSASNMLPSRVVKNTYIVNEPYYGRAKVISISIDSLLLFDAVNGMFMLGPDIPLNGSGNPTSADPYPYWRANFWKDWKREGYMEFFDKQGNFQFESPVQLKVHGGWSRAVGNGKGQKSIRILADGNIGLKEFNYPIIDDKPEVQKYVSFNLRNGGNGYSGLKTREAIMERVMRGSNTPYMAGDLAVVFLNGKYYGFYEIREHENAGFLENNYGVKDDDLDLLGNGYKVFRDAAGAQHWKYDVLNEIQGNSDFLGELVGFAETSVPTSPTFFSEASKRIDIPNVADYLIANTYFGNGDWLSAGTNGVFINNVKYWKPKSSSSKLRFNFMDMDFGSGYNTGTGKDYIIITKTHQSRIGKIFNRLYQNAEFNKYFINRYADLINTVFQPYNFNAIANAKCDSMQSLYTRHSSKWGGSYSSAVSQKNAMITFNTARIDSARKIVRDNFSLIKNVDVTLNVNPPGAGKIVISTLTIPSDSMPWIGVYFDGNPVRLTAVPNPGYSFVNWTPNSLTFNTNDQSIELNISSNSTFTANFTGSSIAADIIVSEINYNSHPNFNSGEWIELRNKTNANLSLHEWKIGDASRYTEYKFPVTASIPANGYVIICSDTAKFKLAYPNYTGKLFGDVEYSLGNKADQIVLKNTTDQIVADISYIDSIWSEGADGNGYTLELKNPNLPLDDVNSWTDGCLGGTPGSSLGTCNYPLVVSEINYNSQVSTNAGDWIELRNTSNSTINLSNWYIMDKDDAVKISIPSGTILNPHQNIVITRDSVLFKQRFPTTSVVPIQLPFGLKSSGDKFRVCASDSSLKYSIRYLNAAPFPTTPNGQGYTLELADSTGYVYNGGVWTIGCLEGSPAAYFDSACGVSANDLYISEINFDPHATLNSGNWFELHNNSSRTIDLKNWKFKNQFTNLTFTVPNTYSMTSGSYIVFTNDTNAFKTIHTGNTSYFKGNLNYALDNNGDGIKIINYKGKEISSAYYNVGSGWPKLAHDKGYTLERKPMPNAGNSTSDWQSGCLGGSPGTPYTPCNYPLIISEINHNSGTSPDMGDWLEVMNNATNPISLNGLKISNDAETVYYSFPNGITLQPSERIVVMEDSSKFRQAVTNASYLTLHLSPTLLNFNLGSTTDGIRLYKNVNGNRLAYSMLYETTGTWPNANANGKTYEILNLNGDPSDGANWFAGCVRGSPSYAYDASCTYLSIGNNIQSSFVLFDLYPNPANDFIQLKLDPQAYGNDLTLEVNDVLGRKKLSFDRTQILSDKINTREWPEGSYYLILRSSNTATQKILVVKH
jgi:hypothetical protein